MIIQHGDVLSPLSVGMRLILSVSIVDTSTTALVNLMKTQNNTSSGGEPTTNSTVSTTQPTANSHSGKKNGQLSYEITPMRYCIKIRRILGYF